MKKTSLFITTIISILSLTSCGNTITHEHTFKGEWSFDESSHWHDATCEHTELTKDKGAHIDSNNDHKCDVCDYEIIVPHEHTFDEEWSNDETNHWHSATCEHSDLTSGFGAHKFGDDNICDDCGYEKIIPHEHTFSDVWSNDESSHWHSATCEHTDLTKDLGSHIDLDNDNICDICDYEFEIIPAKYIVVFNSNFGSYVEPQIVTEGESVYRPDDPTREGYGFYGWYDNAEFSGDMYDFSSKISANTTLYARWGYSLTCINHDGSIHHYEVMLEGDVVEPVADPVKENEIFIGWYRSQTFEGEKFVFNIEIHENIIIYASFGFTVNFYTHDGSLYKSVVVPEGKELEAPISPTKDYHDFDNWYVDEGLITKYNFSSPVTSNFNLYAKFTPSFYQIIYHGCENATNPNPSEYQYTVGIETLLDASQEGYRFYGWYSDETLTNKVTSISTDKHEAIHLYAYFSIEYEVAFTNWPTDVVNNNPTTFTVEERENLDLNPFADYPGFTFVSYVDGEGIIHESTDVDHDLVLDINYVTTTTSVTFDANGGEVIGLENYIYLDSNIPDSEPVKYDVPISIDDTTDGFNPNAHVPQYQNHIFKGWYLDEELTTPINKDSTTIVASGQTLHAKWEEVADGDGYFFKEIGYNNGWQPKPFSLTKYDRVRVPYNAKMINITYFATCDGGNVTVVSNAIYSGTSVSHQIFRSEPNLDFLIEQLSYDVSEDDTITCGAQIICEAGGGYDKCLPMYSYNFSITSYREEFIKVGPSSTATMNVNYWDSVELPYLAREGYTFDGWYNGDTFVDISTHFPFTDETVTLVAHWTKNEEI